MLVTKGYGPSSSHSRRFLSLVIFYVLFLSFVDVSFGAGDELPKSALKPPAFSGNDSDWPVFAMLFTSFLSLTFPLAADLLTRPPRTVVREASGDTAAVTPDDVAADARASAVLFQFLCQVSTDPEFTAYLLEFNGNGFAAWQSLSRRYTGSADDHCLSTVQSLMHLQPSSFSSASAFNAQFNVLLARLSALEESLSPRLQRSIYLAQLYAVYPAFVQSWKLRPSSAPNSLSDAQRAFETFARDGALYSVAVVSARVAAPAASTSAAAPSAAAAAKPLKPGTCPWCRRGVHDISDCYRRRDGLPSADGTPSPFPTLPRDQRPVRPRGNPHRNHNSALPPPNAPVNPAGAFARAAIDVTDPSMASASSLPPLPADLYAQLASAQLQLQQVQGALAAQQPAAQFSAGPSTAAPPAFFAAPAGQSAYAAPATFMPPAHAYPGPPQLPSASVAPSEFTYGSFGPSSAPPPLPHARVAFLPSPASFVSSSFALHVQPAGLPPLSSSAAPPSRASVVDSGASLHIVCELWRFVPSSFVPGSSDVVLADGSRAPIVRGRGLAYILPGAQPMPALYVPSGDMNLISIPTCVRHGIRAVFDPSFAGFVLPTGSQLPFTLRDGLFQLPPLLPRAAVAGVPPSHPRRPQRPLPVPADILHARWGHLADRAVASVSQCSCAALSARGFCEVCAVSNSTTAPTRHSVPRVLSVFGELVHVDLKIFRLKSIDGFLYSCGFVDAFSGFGLTYHLRTKNEAFMAADLWRADTQHFGRTQCFRTDGGGEFVGPDFLAHMRRLLIRHEMTAPDSPNQNSPIERRWRTALAIARALLIHGNMPMSFWSFALTHAFNVLLNYYASGASRVCPYTVLTRMPPPHEYLRVLFCDCYAHVPSADRTSLEYTARPGIFLGFARHSQSYLFWHLATNRICSSRSVTFNERAFSGPRLPGVRAGPLLNWHCPTVALPRPIPPPPAAPLGPAPPAAPVSAPPPSTPGNHSLAHGASSGAPGGISSSHGENGEISPLSPLSPSFLHGEMAKFPWRNGEISPANGDIAPGTGDISRGSPVHRSSPRRPTEHPTTPLVEVNLAPLHRPAPPTPSSFTTPRRPPPSTVRGPPPVLSPVMSSASPSAASGGASGAGHVSGGASPVQDSGMASPVSPCSSAAVFSQQPTLPAPSTSGSGPAVDAADSVTATPCPPRRSTRSTQSHMPDYLGFSPSDFQFRPNARAVAPPVAVPSRVEPSSLRQAWSGPDGPGWYVATDNEVRSLCESDAWVLVFYKPGDNVVKGKWVFKNKHLADGSFEKHKARWVAKGFTQVAGIDFSETFAPTLQLVTFRLLLQLAASHSLVMHHLDINTAFLQSPLTERILMEQPHGYEKYGPNGERLVCLLQKSQYGLKQASRNFSVCLRTYLFSIGFRQADHDPCLFIRGTLGQSDFIGIAVWVDDLFLACGSDASRLAVSADLSRRFKMDDRGPLSSYLSFQISRFNGDVFLCQSAYVQATLQRFGMADCNPASTPLPPGFVAAANTGAPAPRHKEYQERLGCLNWIQHSRPDITHAVNTLARFSSNPSSEHFAASSHLLRYLAGTISKGIFFRKGDGTVRLDGYSDAAFADCPDSGRSTSGYMFRLNPSSGAISFNSRLQKTPTTSTCHAEYTGLYAAACEAVHLRGLLVDLGVLSDSGSLDPLVVARMAPRLDGPDHSPYEMFIRGDNASSLQLARNPIKTKRNKHFEAKLHYTRHLVMANILHLSHVPTSVMWADSFTKPLPAPVLQVHRRVLLGE